MFYDKLVRPISILKSNKAILHFNSIKHVSKLSLDKNFDYEYERKHFKWQIPEYFNFANDFLDNWADKESNQIRNKDIPAFWFIGINGQEIKWNFQQLASESKKTANLLKHNCDLNYKDRAMVILPRLAEWWLINIACIRNGTILSPATIQLRIKDIDLRFERYKPKVIIADPERAQLIDQIVDKHPCIKTKLLVNSKKEINGWLPFDKLFNQSNDNHECIKTKNTDPMMVFFTSGTTGNPKMTVQAHDMGLAHFITGKYILDVSFDDVVWSLSDTGWAKTAFMSFFGPWTQGCGVFITEEGFSSSHLLKTLRKYTISTLCIPPTAYRMAVLEDRKNFKFKALRYCLSGGESINHETISKWKEYTGLEIYKGYGQTETAALIASNSHIKSKPESMGKTVPGIDIRIVDNEGQEVPIGTEGNIALRVKPERPPGLFIHYLDDPDKTASCFKGDFYFTGDRAYKDGEDYFWFVGRDDDIIISAGYRIGPFEVENALMEHPAVIENAVVSSPDPIRGEIVKAFIILSQEYLDKDKKLLTKELQEHVKTITAPYKYPRQIEFVTELPKTISGKIRRVELREREWKKR